ncbi:hypothetical protein J6Y73_05120 [bacterium]|nr:hypothetical protein [bacterium]
MEISRKKKLTSAIVSLSFAFLITVLSILFFTDYTLGWFSENKKVASNGFVIQTEKNSQVTTLSTYAFRYDGMYGAICIPIEDNTEIAMSEYDVIFTDKNVNTPLFFRVVARGVPSTGGSITVTIPCTTPTYSLNSAVSTFNDGKNTLDVLSNLVTCKLGFGLMLNEEKVVDNFIPVGTTTSRVSSNISIFTGVRDLMTKNKMAENKVESGKFINKEEFDDDGNIVSAEKTTTTISLTISYEDYEEYLCGVVIDEETKEITEYDYNAEVKDCLVFYIEFDYDDNLINLFRQHTEESGLAEFRNDIGVISIQDNRG